MGKVNATLNVLTRLIASGEATDPLIEHLGMRDVTQSPRELNLFDKETGPKIFVETKEYLECDWDDLFLDQDAALRRIFNWIRLNGAKGCRLSCSMSHDASSVAYKLHMTLEDRSALRFRYEFDMTDPRHPQFRKCSGRMRRGNANYFLAPFSIASEMRQSPSAFLQCIRECPEYEQIQDMAATLAKEGFVGHLHNLPPRKEPWTEESYFEQGNWGEQIERTVHMAAYGKERFEYELNDKGEECVTLRCGKILKCLFKQRSGEDGRLKKIVFGETEGGAAAAAESAKLAAKEKPASKATAAPEPANAPKAKGESQKKRALNAQHATAAPKYRRVEIQAEDVLVRLETGNYEAHAHATERVEISVEVKQTYGRAQRIPVTAYYCSKCKTYLLSPFAYNTLKGKDRFICCKVVKDGETDSRGNLIERRSTERFLAEESLLHSYGYNVGKKDSLTLAQRRMILEFVVDRGIITPQRAIDFLQYLADRAKSRKKADMSNAIHCWETDIAYLRGFEK